MCKRFCLLLESQFGNDSRRRTRQHRRMGPHALEARVTRLPAYEAHVDLLDNGRSLPTRPCAVKSDIAYIAARPPCVPLFQFAAREKPRLRRMRVAFAELDQLLRAF